MKTNEPRLAMFTTEILDGHSFWAWFSQQIGVLVIPLVLAALSGSFAEKIDGELTSPLRILFDIVWNAVFVWGIAFFLGLAVHRFFPRAGVTGRWVWIVPMLLFFTVFASDALRYSFKDTLSEFFYPGPNGEDWWVLAGITYPACAATLYSISMFLASRKTRQRLREDSAPSVQR
jgi:hypothetical protein